MTEQAWKDRTIMYLFGPMYKTILGKSKMMLYIALTALLLAFIACLYTWLYAGHSSVSVKGRNGDKEQTDKEEQNSQLKRDEMDDMDAWWWMWTNQMI